MLQGDGSRLECNLCGTSFDLDGAEVFMLELRDVSELRRMAIETQIDTFGEFAQEVWQVVFGSNNGLKSALKNWATLLGFTVVFIFGRTSKHTGVPTTTAMNVSL